MVGKIATGEIAQLVKIYGEAPDGSKGRYSPAACTGIKKTRSKASRTKTYAT